MGYRLYQFIGTDQDLIDNGFEVDPNHPTIRAIKSRPYVFDPLELCVVWRNHIIENHLDIINAYTTSNELMLKGLIDKGLIKIIDKE